MKNHLPGNVFLINEFSFCAKARDMRFFFDDELFSTRLLVVFLPFGK